MAKRNSRHDEIIVVHHPQLGLQTTTSRGAFEAPKSTTRTKSRPGEGGLALKGWKEGPLPEKAKTGGGS